MSRDGRTLSPGAGWGRAQANLLALVLALAALTAATGLAVVVADGALGTAQRDTVERRAATAAADRLVAADAPTTRRANVLDAATVSNLTVDRAVRLAPPLSGRAFRVRVAGETVLQRGAPTGPTARRLVLAAATEPRTRTLNLSTATELVVPLRTDRLRIAIADASVETVQANGAVLLHDPGGVGNATVSVPRERTTRLSFETDGEGGVVRVTYWPERTEKGLLEVTVGD
ncbi:MAG: hypothetical protein ABEJ79_11385 [Halolamina sp.]